MTFIYRPKHPKADRFGMIDRALLEYEPNQAPHVISDHMEPLKHMATGRTIDSKAKFRAETRASGCVEIGTEPIRPRKQVMLDKGQRREALRKAIYDLRNGYRPPQFAPDD